MFGLAKLETPIAFDLLDFERVERGVSPFPWVVDFGLIEPIVFEQIAWIVQVGSFFDISHGWDPQISCVEEHKEEEVPLKVLVAVEDSKEVED